MGGRSVLIALLALAYVGVASADVENTQFVDTFARLDESRWRVADGWANGEWTANDWRRTQIQHAPGLVDITLARTREGPKRFTSGELQTQDVYQYGYFEVRMRAPRGSGLVSGFFTYTRDGPESTWDEIDVEILGRRTNSVMLSYFRDGRRYSVTRRLPFDAARGQHTYGFEWTPTRLRWYADGELIHEETGANGPLPQRPQRLYVHLWNTETLTDWLGPIMPWGGPWRLRVSCVAHADYYRGRPLCSGGRR